MSDGVFETVDTVSRRGTHKRGLRFDVSQLPFFGPEVTDEYAISKSNSAFKAAVVKLIVAHFWGAVVLDESIEYPEASLDVQDDGLSVIVLDMSGRIRQEHLSELLAAAINGTVVTLGLDLEPEESPQSEG